MAVETIFKKHFNRSSWSRGSQFCSDVRYTLLGIKPALLIDGLIPDAGKIQLFVKELFHLGGFAGDTNVFLLAIGEDVLIVNGVSLSHLVTTSPPPILLDVTKGNDRPMIMDDSKRESIVSYCLKMLPKGLPGYISPTEVSVPIYTIPCSLSSQMSPTKLPSPPAFLPPIHVCSEPVSILNLCTVFGYLLHYPVVYWFDSERGHCLDMEDLVQHKVTVSCSNGEKAEQGSPHTLYSFTVPKCLLSEGDSGVVDVVCDWFTNLQKLATEKGYRAEMETKSITMTTIIL